MKVILLKNVEGLGERNEIKEVSGGYARNYLLAKNLARPASKEALADLEQMKATRTKEAAEELSQAQELAARLDGQEIEIKAKVSEGDKLYAAINKEKIAKELGARGFKVKKDQVGLETPIKTLGEHEVNISLDHGLEVKIKLLIQE